MSTEEKEITRRLNAWQHGDSHALDEIMPFIYSDLKAIAGGYMRRERPGHTLQPTALIHEVFLKLNTNRRIQWHSRTHFLATAATFMRRILVDHARERSAVKRGRDWNLVSLDNALELAMERSPDLIALDDALTRLETIAPEQARLVELRYFGGLSISETAEILGVTSRTVKRRWRTARMWLFRYLMGELDVDKPLA